MSLKTNKKQPRRNSKKSAALTPSQKAHQTAREARIHCKVEITKRCKKSGWQTVEFTGKNKSESAGIVDLISIRKDHCSHGSGFKRGDKFELILIQTKGGKSREPTQEDIARLRSVKKYYRARDVVLVRWRKGQEFSFHKLVGSKWETSESALLFA